MILYFILVIFIVKIIKTILSSLKINNIFQNPLHPITVDNVLVSEIEESLPKDKYAHFNPTTPYIVKLDMRTKNIRNLKCYTKELSYHMLALELIKEFHADTAMIVDNMIILIFSNDMMRDNKLFNGDNDKINSIIASYASSTLSLDIGKRCSFFSKKQPFDLKNISSIYKMAKSKNITSYFIKKNIKNNNNNIKKNNNIKNNNIKKNKNNYIKFTLNKIKLNRFYSNLLLKVINKKNISFNKFLDINLLQ